MPRGSTINDSHFPALLRTQVMMNMSKFSKSVNFFSILTIMI